MNEVSTCAFESKETLMAHHKGTGKLRAAIPSKKENK